MKKVILDTNVYISAFITQGSCYDLYNSILDNHLLCISDFILEELYKNLQKKCHLTVEETTAVLRDIKMSSKYEQNIVELNEKISNVSDDNILALALHAQADVICTGDQDLLILKKYKKIPIIEPKDFWRWEDNQL